jgi:hypothetical protein
MWMLLVTGLLAACNSSDRGTPSASTVAGAAGSASLPTAPLNTASESRATKPTSATVSLDCSRPIDAMVAPPQGFEAVGDAVALQTSASAPDAIQAGVTGDGDPVRRLFAKTPLLVRPDEQSEVLVAPEWINRAFVWWGNTGGQEPSARFVVGPCHTGSTKWIVFPGGITVSEPGCIELIVRHDGTDNRVSLGIGAACPGQGPPVGPSDT